MKQTKFSGRHLGFLVTAFAVVGLLAAPLTTAFAATATSRSVELSSSSLGATNVQYKLSFTTGTAAAGAAVIYFCNNSPLKGAACTAPTGFTAASATVSTPFSKVGSTANRIEVSGTFGASEDIELELAGITNPTVASVTEPLYVRVVTYASPGDATGTTATALGLNQVDDGSMAIAITPTIGVSGDVLETLTFCVSGGTQADKEVSPIGDGCTGTLTAPTLKLGTDAGGIVSLQPGTVSEGKIFTQISTNAAKGAIVRLKSSAVGCGGLLRAGAASACDIAPAQQTGIVAGDAKFGVKTAASTDGAGARGLYQPYGTLAANAYYSNDTFSMRYVDANDGVTSPFGDRFLETAEAPANNKNMALTFGVAASNNTPAGNYSADLSLIAVGTF